MNCDGSEASFLFLTGLRVLTSSHVLSLSAERALKLARCCVSELQLEVNFVSRVYRSTISI